jgi:hypothetical protein
MNKLPTTKLLVLLLGLSLTFTVCEAQSNKSGYGNTRIKEPRSVTKAKKKQEDKERKLKKDSADFVKENKKRSLEIQSPEVRARMIENRKNAEYRYKEKKKRTSENTRKAAKKYRKY